ncbi:MAG: protease [Syntrophomonadaceae bacterium]|jgi:membrane protein implicated in regulation of membrane protease activity
MQTVYWGCLYGGIIFALVTIIFGDILGDIFSGLDSLSFDHLDFLSPMVIVGGITAFGGTGIMLDRLTSLETLIIIILSLIIAIALSVFVYFIYVRPMKNAENSNSYTMSDLVGKIGIVTVPVPKNGFGEVLIRIGAGNTNHIACSCDGEGFTQGTRVIVAEIKDGVVNVFRYQDD